MTMDDNRTGSAGIKTRLFLFKIGLCGFIAGLLLSVFSLFIMGASALLALVWQDVMIIGGAGKLAEIVLPVVFPSPFICLILFFIALMMKPRDMDMPALMKSSMSGIISLFAAGVQLCALPLLFSFLIVMAVLYFRGGGIIFLSIAYFALACILFFMSAGYVMLREIAGNRELKTDVAWLNRLFRVLRVGGGKTSPVMDDTARRALTRAERVLGSLLGVVLFFLFGVRDAYEAIRRMTGHGYDGGILDELISPGAFLAVLSCFIFVFSSLFIIRSVKMVFSGTPGAKND
jgi:hypothetical protein